MKLDEGVYSLFFITTMHPNFIYYYTQVHGTAEGNAFIKEMSKYDTNREVNSKREIKTYADDTIVENHIEEMLKMRFHLRKDLQNVMV